MSEPSRRLALAADVLALLARVIDASQKSKGAPATVPGIQMISVPGPRFKVGHFSTRNEGFSKHVREVRSLIQDYAARRSATKPLNLLISAPPGSGKSFLVKQLLTRKDANDLTIPHLELNISNIASRMDLGAAWSFIRTMAANRITPCVFFDEIDSVVGSEYLLKDLIMPMNDAAVIHDGVRLPLGPAVFIFAGSKLFEPQTAVGPLAGGAANKIRFDTWVTEREKSIRALGSPPPRKKGKSKAGTDLGPTHTVPKVRDFLDRIDRCIVFPDPRVNFDGVDEQVMENEALDLVLSLIGKHFPHVKCVEVTAAAALAVALRGGASKRSAERLIFTSIVAPTEQLFKFSHLTPDAQQLLSQDKLAETKAKYDGKAFRID